MKLVDQKSELSLEDIIEVSELMNTWGKERSERYNQLEWVKDKDFLSRFLKFIGPQRGDYVLDFGTGTGAVAHALASKVKKVVGIDTDSQMLVQAKKIAGSNEVYKKVDIRLPNDLGLFDRVVERQALHGLTQGLKEAIRNSFNYLREDGVFCSCEGMPWNRQVEQNNRDEMRLLEDRLILFPEMIQDLMKEVGFKDISFEIVCLPGQSTRKWLEARGVNKVTIENLLNIRRYAPDYWKKAYNAKVADGDVLVDTPWFFIKGYKRARNGS